MKSVLNLASVVIAMAICTGASASEVTIGVERLGVFKDLAANPAWQMYAKDENVARFFKKNVIHENNQAKAWVIVVMDDVAARTASDQAGGMKALPRKIVALRQFKCGQEQSRTLQSDRYSASGRYIGGEHADDPAWGNVEPDDQPLYRQACTPPGP